jgi:Mg2+ and Co2+ transporter CorA
VVTIFGLVATVVTGYFGMNLFDFGAAPHAAKLLQIASVTSLTVALVLFTVARSKRLSDFLEALSDERLNLQAKWSAFIQVFRR